MTTQALLQDAILVAGQSVPPRMSALAKYIDDLGKLKKGQISDHELDLLKVADAFQSNLQIIDLAVAISVGGILPGGLPRLAVATYHASLERNTLDSWLWADGRVAFQVSDNHNYDFEFGEGTLGVSDNPFRRFWSYPLSGTNAIPLVPPQIRPEIPEKNPDGTRVDTRKFLQQFAVLFEVKKWDPNPRAVDPYLLKKIAGNIYAVAGTWDLTEAELGAYRAARQMGI